MEAGRGSRLGGLEEPVPLSQATLARGSAFCSPPSGLPRVQGQGGGPLLLVSTPLCDVTVGWGLSPIPGS